MTIGIFYTKYFSKNTVISKRTLGYVLGLWSKMCRPVSERLVSVAKYTIEKLWF